MRAYKFRLYPNHEEERKLLWTLEMCRWTYNRFLGLYYGGENDRAKLQALLPVWKESDPDLRAVHSKVLQYELHKMFANLAALREMRKSGRRTGKLRFKPSHRFRTFTYNQFGFKLISKNDKLSFLHLSKIGDIPIRTHRAVEGTIKGVTVKHMPSGKWFAMLLVDNGRGEDELTVIDRSVGLDVGITSYVVDSDGNEVENPRWLKRELKKLRREQRRLSRKQKGSKNWNKQRIIVARTHEKVGNRRDDFQHKLSHYYVGKYDLITTEKLHPTNMVQNHRLARSIQDAAWSSFNQKLAYKAERAGKLYVQVDARHTSQICPACGRVEPKTLGQRVHDCTCGFKDTRDHASSLVVLDRGLRKVRSERPELTLVDSRPLQLPASGLQVDWMMQETLPSREG